MPILILPARYSEDSILLWQAAIFEGWTVRRLQAWRVSEVFDDDVTVSIYGEPLFAATIAEQLSLILLEPPFDWLSHLPFHFVKRHITFMRLSKLNTVTFPAFVKPADDKCFPAGVYHSQSEIPGINLLEGTTPILISEPVTWDVEFRAFILEHHCETLSIYARHGKLAQATDGSWPSDDGELREAKDFLHTVLSDHTIPLPPSVVIDIGKIAGKGWAIIEANPSWSSGVYGCDPTAVLHTIIRGCPHRRELKSEDTRWIISR